MRYVKCQTDTEFTLDKSRVLWYSEGMEELTINQLVAAATYSLMTLLVIAFALADVDRSSSFYEIRKIILRTAGITVFVLFLVRLVVILSMLMER